MRFATLLAALPLAACVSVTAPSTGTTPTSAGGQCDAAGARSLVGQKASSETGARVLDLSGAASLRWGPPGAMWTMDYRQDRVNVRYDATMTITEITCG